MKFQTRILLTGLIITVILALCFLLPSKENQKNIVTQTKVCSSSTCRKESLRLWDYGNVKTDPCSNFYVHACGKIINEYKENNFAPYMSQLSLLTMRINQKLKNDFAAPISVNDTMYMKILKSFYIKCTKRDDYNVNDVLKYIASLGGWPLLGIASTNKNYIYENNDYLDLYNSIMHLKEAKIDISLPFKITKKGPSVQIKPIESFISENESIKSVQIDISKIANFLGGNRDIIKYDLKEMFDLEMKIRKNSDFHHELSQRHSMDSLYHNFPGLNWQLLLGRISSTDSIIVHDVYQTKKISELIISYPRAFTNYLIWNAILPYTKFIAHETNYWQVYKYSLSHDDINKQRIDDCIDSSLETIALNAFFTKQYIKESKKNIETIYSRIENVAEKFLKKKAVNDTRSLISINKLKKLKNMIGYPDYLTYENIINVYYSTIPYQERSTFDIFVDIIKADTKIKSYLTKFMGTKFETRDDVVIAHADPGYDPKIHRIIVPGGILFPPYYHEKRPDYLNFGGIGFLIGHEIIHAVKYQDEKTQDCLITQFSQFHLSQIDRFVDGFRTRKENFADYFGIQLAYDAYQVLRASRDEEPRLMHFANYTANQMFWISAASVWCEYSDNDDLMRAVSEDEHSPGESRINLGFANNKNFVEDFNCPPGSAMNPEEKC